MSLWDSPTDCVADWEPQDPAPRHAAALWGKVVELVRVIERRVTLFWKLGPTTACAVKVAKPQKPQDCAGPLFHSATVWREREQLEMIAQTFHRTLSLEEGNPRGSWTI